MKTAELKPAAHLHTPHFLPCQLGFQGDIEAVPHYNDLNRVVNYEATVYELGGGDSFSCFGLTAERASAQAKRIVADLNARASLTAEVSELRAEVARLKNNR